jgi:ADP-ribose pyrophosphatase
MTDEQNHLDKPASRDLGWQRLDTRYPFVGRRFRICQDHVRLPNGDELDYAYTESQGAVWVVPLTEDGQVILIRQYRYPIDEWGWEIPAGSFYDHEGTMEELARREMLEEIGATCEELIYVNWFYGAVSASDSVCHVTLARGTRLDQKPQREAAEFIETHLLTVEDALSLARNGQMRDGRSALALLLCETLLRKD